MKRKSTLIFLLLFSLNCLAHIGSPGVTYEGKAGAYKVLVNITPPDVIPGTVAVTVYLEDFSKDVRVSARPIYFTSGGEGTPKSDPAVSSKDQPGRYDVTIWFMNSGASSVEILIEGPKGKGNVVIPVMAVSTAMRDMPAGLGWGLLGMALFLVILMVTIIGSSVSDGLLKPSESMTKRLAKRKVIGMIGSVFILGLILWAGKTWWNSKADEHKRLLYRPYQASTTLNMEDQTLSFRIDSTEINAMKKTGRLITTRKLNYLVPDHGKLMHLFMVRAGALNAFAHLHPKRIDSVTFVASLPMMMPGKYWIYADITRLSGFSETIVDTVEVPEMRVISASNKAPMPPNRDDTWFITNSIRERTATFNGIPVAVCGKPGVQVALQDGSSAVWMQPPGEQIKPGKLTTLKFAITDPDGKPAVLDPYLGMMGHAVILKEDGTVYIHLHPAGNFSMGSQRALLDRIAFHKPLAEYLPRPQVFADSINRLIEKLDAMNESERNKLLMPEMYIPGAAPHSSHEVSFPYAFPKAGKYRIWVQVKRNGKILNSAFDAEVKD